MLLYAPVWFGMVPEVSSKYNTDCAKPTKTSNKCTTDNTTKKDRCRRPHASLNDGGCRRRAGM